MAILFLFPLLLSCGANYETLYEITKGDVTYTLEGTGGIPKRISLIKDGYAIYRLDIHPDASVGSDNGTYGFFVEDANFDGVNDLFIATKKEGELCTYDVYLATNGGSSFTKSKELSALTNVRVKKEYNAVFGFTQTKAPAGGDHYTLCDRSTKYVWENGRLVPDLYVALTYYSEQNLYCYSTAIYDENAKDFDPPRDKWLTPSEYEKTDFGFLYYYK